MKRGHELGIPDLDRRAWLAGLLLAGIRPRAGRAAQDPPVPAEEEADIEAIRAHAKAAALGPFGVTRTDHYAAVGDAPEAFRKEALEVCEAVARDCLKYFQDKGFPVKAPGRRLVVVVLADAPAFSKYFGILREAAVGGIYDVASNHLVIFDFRKGGGATKAARANTVALVHEAAHQWTYNAGLLRRGGDVPVAVSEGLAMLVEDRPPTGRATPGGLNKGRIDGLKLALRNGVAWSPIDKLLSDDSLAGGFGDELAAQLAYAQDWLLVYHLMRSRLDPFRTYLKSIADRQAPAHRLEDARRAFGDLERLDAELKRLANGLVNS